MLRALKGSCLGLGLFLRGLGRGGVGLVLGGWVGGGLLGLGGVLGVGAGCGLPAVGHVVVGACRVTQRVSTDAVDVSVQVLSGNMRL